MQHFNAYVDAIVASPPRYDQQDLADRRGMGGSVFRDLMAGVVYTPEFFAALQDVLHTDEFAQRMAWGLQYNTTLIFRQRDDDHHQGGWGDLHDYGIRYFALDAFANMAANAAGARLNEQIRRGELEVEGLKAEDINESAKPQMSTVDAASPAASQLEAYLRQVAQDGAVPADAVRQAAAANDKAMFRAIAEVAGSPEFGRKLVGQLEDRLTIRGEGAEQKLIGWGRTGPGDSAKAVEAAFQQLVSERAQQLDSPADLSL